MSGERQLPGLGLYGFWTLGSNGWKDQNDSNWRIVSALLNRKVKSRTTVLPGTPTLGDIYIVKSDDGTHPDEIAIWDGPSGSEAWVYLTPDKGWMFWIDDESMFYHWNGTDWTESFPEYVPPASTYSVETSDYVAVNGDFDGKTIIAMSVSTANTFTVNSGITGTESVTIMQLGTGQTEIVAGSGVTIHYTDTLKLRTTKSLASLIRLAADTYVLIGDVEAAP